MSRTAQLKEVECEMLSAVEDRLCDLGAMIPFYQGQFHIECVVE